jgi:hypothetical protein
MGMKTDQIFFEVECIELFNEIYSIIEDALSGIEDKKNIEHISEQILLYAWDASRRKNIGTWE